MNLHAPVTRLPCAGSAAALGVAPADLACQACEPVAWGWASVILQGVVDEKGPPARYFWRSGGCCSRRASQILAWLEVFLGRDRKGGDSR